MAVFCYSPAPLQERHIRIRIRLRLPFTSRFDRDAPPRGVFPVAMKPVVDGDSGGGGRALPTGSKRAAAFLLSIAAWGVYTWAIGGADDSSIGGQRQLVATYVAQMVKGAWARSGDGNATARGDGARCFGDAARTARAARRSSFPRTLMDGSTTHRPPDGSTGEFALQLQRVRVSSGRRQGEAQCRVRSRGNASRTWATVHRTVHDPRRTPRQGGACAHMPARSTHHAYVKAAVSIGFRNRWSRFLKTSVSLSIQSSFLYCVMLKTSSLDSAWPQNCAA